MILCFRRETYIYSSQVYKLGRAGFIPVYKMVLYFQRDYTMAIRACSHDISSVIDIVWTTIFSFWEQLSTWTHTIEANLFQVWSDSNKLEYPGKIQNTQIFPWIVPRCVSVIVKYLIGFSAFFQVNFTLHIYIFSFAFCRFRCLIFWILMQTKTMHIVCFISLEPHPFNDNNINTETGFYKNRYQIIQWRSVGIWSTLSLCLWLLTSKKILFYWSGRSVTWAG